MTKNNGDAGWFAKARKAIDTVGSINIFIASQNGDEFYNDLAAQINDEMLRSRKGTPAILVANDRYEVQLLKDVYDQHAPVLDLYKNGLEAGLLDVARKSARPGQQIHFPTSPVVEFKARLQADDSGEEKSEEPVVVRSSASGPFDLKKIEVAIPVQLVQPVGDVEAERQALTEARLVVLARAGEDSEQRLEFLTKRDGRLIVIGRRSDDPRFQAIDSLRVSRDHALLFYEDADWFITDGDRKGNGSANGTFVDGNKLELGERRKLDPGMLIGFPDNKAYSWKVLEIA